MEILLLIKFILDIYIVYLYSVLYLNQWVLTSVKFDWQMGQDHMYHSVYRILGVIVY